MRGLAGSAAAAELERPKAGKVEIFPLKDIKPGMKGIAWTVFQGTEPEPVPIEIIGVWKGSGAAGRDPGENGRQSQRDQRRRRHERQPGLYRRQTGGRGRAAHQRVFSPDAICGITPIELMLEIQDFDKSRPSDARTPDKAIAGPRGGHRNSRRNAEPIRGCRRVNGSSDARSDDDADRHAAGAFRILRRRPSTRFSRCSTRWESPPCRAAPARRTLTAKPATGWEHSLNPGEAVSGILVSGDMSATGMGTVTYNDGKRILAFGHPFFNLGPLDMPMAKSEILMVLSSAFQPTKFGNATEVVGALRQDRYSGIMGELGAEAPSIPVHLKVRSHRRPATPSSRRRISTSTSSSIRSGRRS